MTWKHKYRRNTQSQSRQGSGGNCARFLSIVPFLLFWLSSCFCLLLLSIFLRQMQGFQQCCPCALGWISLFFMLLLSVLFLLLSNLGTTLISDWNFPGGSDGKESHAGSIPESGRSPGEGNGNPLQYSCLENSMDRGVWRATVHGVIKSWTWLSGYHFHSLISELCQSRSQVNNG